MNTEYKISFVILHYQLLEITKVCVNCIETIFSNYNIDIIVIDNASPNGSGKELDTFYSSDDMVTVIRCKENYGFSKGNNIGYKMAKQHNSDFIIVMNNDVEIHQSDFLKILFEEYEKNQCHVMGPDIVNLDGVHQSPQREHYISKSELRKWYCKRAFFLKSLMLARKIPYLAKVLRKQYMEHDKERIGDFDSVKPKFDVELQGACFIFTPQFLQEREYPFEEISFMYGEEPMMGVLCKIKGWHTYYNPKLRILHKEKSTTRNENIDYIEHEIFYTKNMIVGLRNIINGYL